MVARYPVQHAATLVMDTGGRMVGGEWIEGEKKEVKLVGRFDHSNSSRHVLKKNSTGDVLEVYGEYYTKTPLPAGPIKAAVLKIPGLGIDMPIITAESYQTHSVIYI